MNSEFALKGVLEPRSLNYESSFTSRGILLLGLGDRFWVVAKTNSKNNKCKGEVFVLAISSLLPVAFSQKPFFVSVHIDTHIKMSPRPHIIQNIECIREKNH